MVARRTMDIAESRSAEMQFIADARLEAVARIVVAIRKDIERRVRANEPFSEIDIGLQRKFEASVAEILTAAHLLGREQIVDQALAALDRMRAKRRSLDTVDQLALAVIERLSIEDDALFALRASYAGRAAAVFSQTRTLVTPAINAMTTSIRLGEILPVAIGRLRAGFVAAGVTNIASHTLETMVRTQTAIAYAAGEDNADKDPFVDEILWGYEYVTVGDDRVRPNHVAMEGITLPKDDPFWDSNSPPNGFNCRCVRVRVFVDDEISRVEANAVDVDGVIVSPQADPGFEFNAGQLQRDVLQLRPPRAASTGLRGRWAVLGSLSRRGGQARMSDLVRDTGKAKSTISDQVERLATAGMVEHEPCSGEVAITERGRARLAND